MRGRRGRGADVRLRPARLADAPALARVMAAAVRGLAGRFYPAREVAAWSSLPALYHAWAMAAGGESYLVAERGGRVVGYAARRGAEVTAVFVRPAAARRGIGAALLARVEREARRAGLRRLRVTAALSALAFYEARGFSGARRVAVPLPGGRALEARALGKRIRRRPGASSVARRRSPSRGRAREERAAEA